MYKVVKVSFIFILVALSGCFEKDVYSDIPKIEFEDLTFFDSDISTDTLILKFGFENGGSGFGIESELDFLPPYYNQYNVFLDSADNVINENNYATATLPIFKVPVVLRDIRIIFSNGEFFWDNGDSYALIGTSRKPLASLDELPELSCPNLMNSSGSLDTVDFKIYNLVDDNIDVKEVSVNGLTLVEPVETHYNFHISFQEKIGGEFVDLDFTKEFDVDPNDCTFGNFNAQIPIFDIGSEKGVITYKIESQGFIAAFAANEIRIKFYIFDRGLNKSNEVTYDFFLSEITQ